MTPSVVAHQRRASRMDATALYSIAVGRSSPSPANRVSAVPVTIAGARASGRRVAHAAALLVPPGAAGAGSAPG
jgi:hypothetical protein